MWHQKSVCLHRRNQPSTFSSKTWNWSATEFCRPKHLGRPHSLSVKSRKLRDQSLKWRKLLWGTLMWYWCQLTYRWAEIMFWKFSISLQLATWSVSQAEPRFVALVQCGLRVQCGWAKRSTKELSCFPVSAQFEAVSVTSCKTDSNESLGTRFCVPGVRRTNGNTSDACKCCGSNFTTESKQIGDYWTDMFCSFKIS